MNLTGKKMSNEDIQFIFHVFEQNRAVLHGNYISLEEWTEYFKSLDVTGGGDPYESHHIIMADTIPAAWLKINGWNKPEITISLLAVDNEYKHKGVGRFAIQFAEKQARYWGKSAVRVQTTRDNAIATECYLKCGYEIVREMIYKVGDGVDREGYEFGKTILPEALTEEALTGVLSKMLGAKIIHADFHSTQLQGGTIGDVRLVTGIAETVDRGKLPYTVVLKEQKKFDRFGDPGSWRREHDLYASDFGTLFTDSLRWPECYHTELSNDKWQIWMEHIDGISGANLTIEMLEQAAIELGRFQGRLHERRPAILHDNKNMGALEFMKADYSQWKPSTDEYRYIRSEDCTIPKHLCRMLIDMDNEVEAVFENIKKLPIVFCHRDFWIENIFNLNGKTILIDWDTSGPGYMGEDIASLIIDDTDVQFIEEYYDKLIPAYYQGVSEYMDVSSITNHYIWEMILIKEGYRNVHRYMFGKPAEQKSLYINVLQKIYELGNKSRHAMSFCDKIDTIGNCINNN